MLSTVKKNININIKMAERLQTERKKLYIYLRLEDLHSKY